MIRSFLYEYAFNCLATFSPVLSLFFYYWCVDYVFILVDLINPLASKRTILIDLQITSGFMLLSLLYRFLATLRSHHGNYYNNRILEVLYDATKKHEINRQCGWI